MLDLTGITLSEETLCAIPANCPNLRLFNLAECTITENVQDKVSPSFAKVVPNLEALDLSHFMQAFNSNLLFSLASTCKKMRSINLYCCDLPNIDDVIRVLAKTASQLEVLNLSYTKITDKSLISLATFAHALMILSIVECTPLTGSGLAKLAENCHSLYHLDLTRCVNITETSLLAFTKAAKYGCKANLRELYLKCCFHTTSEVVVGIAETFHLLEDLDLQHNHLITTEAVAKLEKIQTLLWLDIRGCNLVSQEIVRKMRENNQLLSIYSSSIKYAESEILYDDI